jgi:hypothetical protein
VWDRRKSGVAMKLPNLEQGNDERRYGRGDHLEALRELSLDDILQGLESTEDEESSVEEMEEYDDKSEFQVWSFVIVRKKYGRRSRDDTQSLYMNGAL